MKSNNYVKMWTTKKFKEFLYKKKAEDPSKTFGEIMNDMIKDKKKKKNDNFFGKF